MILKVKYLIKEFIILLGLLCICFITNVNAATEDDFSVQNGILTKYTGTDSEFSIPSDVIGIGPGAFSESSLTTISIPSNINSIGEAAFYNCKELTTVNIEEGVCYIGNSAFADCPALYAINIPSTVATIGRGVFADDISLSTVAIKGDNYFYNDGAIYNYDSTKLIQYLPGNPSAYYDMPFSVKEIEKYAFWGAINLNYISVSNNVKLIPAYAFSGCRSLKGVFLPDNIKRVDDYAFYNCKDLKYVGSENSSVVISSTAFSGCDDVETASGVTQNQANTMIKAIAQREKKEKQKKKQEEQKSKEVELSGALGIIEHGEVTILDAIEMDREENYATLSGEIGAAKTNNGNVNIFFDKDAESIGTITPDMQGEREKAREAARLAKIEEEKRMKEEAEQELKRQLDDKRKNAFANWKNK